MLHDQRAADPFDGFDVHTPAMHVQGHEFIAIRRRPVIALINHHSDVRVAAAKIIGAAAAAVRVVPFLAGIPMVVVRLLIDEFVDKRIRVLAVHALEVRAMDALPAVTDHGVDEQELVILGPVGAPRVSRAMAVGLEDFLHRVITPQTARSGLTLRLLHAGDIDPRGTRDTHATVEPTVRAPLKSVRKGMATRGGRAKSIEDDFRWARGLITSHRNEEQVRRAQRPHAAEAALDTGEHLHVFRNDGAFIELPVAVSIFEDDNPVAELEVEAFLAVGISIVLGDPQAATLVPAKGDGLTDIGLGGKERGGEPLGQVEFGQRIRGLQ